MCANARVCAIARVSIDRYVSNFPWLEKMMPVKTDASMTYLLNFIDQLIVKFIHHRNQLKYYRSSIKDFYNLFDSVNLDIDFSENLTLPIKHQAQSLHWSYTQITVHSGILKADGEKCTMLICLTIGSMTKPSLRLSLKVC